jgi:hypothetical protein
MLLPVMTVKRRYFIAIGGWTIAAMLAPTANFERLTFSEAAAKADAMNVVYIEGSSAQQLSQQVRDRLRALNLQMSGGAPANVLLAFEPSPIVPPYY